MAFAVEGFFLKVIACMPDWEKFATPFSVKVNDKVVYEDDHTFFEQVNLGWPAFYIRLSSEVLCLGENTVTVKLLSIRQKAAEYPKEGYFGCFDVQRIFIRKAQCHFSWDWAPNFPAMGIWLDVRLEVLPGNEISHVIIKPELDGRAAMIVHLGKDLN